MSVRERLIIFMHIPKTGGTTLCNILHRRYPDSVRITSVHAAVPEILPNKARLNTPSLLHGHLGYDQVKDLPGTFLFTFLRSPVQRALSHYFFLKGTPSNEYYNYLNRPDTTVESFYALKTKRDIDNCLVRYLSGRHKDFGTINEQDYLLAMHNLEHKLGFFGLQENYDESLIMLGKQLGWSLPVYRVKNKTKQKEMVSESTLEFLTKANKWDVLLYEKAEFLFREKLAKMDTSDNRKLAQLKILNRIVSLISS